MSSPAKRAKQTTRKSLQRVGYCMEIHWEPLIYEASRYALSRVLAGCPAQAQRVLLVGHNPGLENLLGLSVRFVAVVGGRQVVADRHKWLN
ncbi:MAG: hypothetical protein R3F37_19930 [Candidatus Competibacteraceae bacterium]